MPVKGVSEDMRIAVMMRFALGNPDPAKGGAPNEAAWFVPKAPGDDKDDPTFKRVIEVYGATPRRLRGMFLMDVGAVNPTTGQELSWWCYNVAYGSGKGMRCLGTGGSSEHGAGADGETIDKRGTATTSDKDWAELIGVQTGVAPIPLANGRYQIQCWGRDCRKFYRVKEIPGARKPPMEDGHDADAACKLVGVLRFLLLDTNDRPICTAQVTTGSINSIRSIQWGLREIVAFNAQHRSAAIPFWLIRSPQKIPWGGSRRTHHIIKLWASPDDVNRYGLIPQEQVFLGIEERTQYLRLMAGTPVSYDDVADVLPQTHDARLLGALAAPPVEERPPVTEPPPIDRDDLREAPLPPVATVLDSPIAADLDAQAAVEGVPPPPSALAPQPDDDDPAPQDLRESLKRRFGLPAQYPRSGTAEYNEVLQRARDFRELVNRARVETGDEPIQQPIGSMTLKHARWLEAHLAEEERRRGAAGPPPETGEQGSLL